MRRVFALDGPVMTALGKIADIVLCNIMFLLLSLPVITAGAALTGLYTCMQALVKGTEDSIIVRQFWNGFRKNWKQATGLWLICLAAALFLGAFYWAISQLTGGMARAYRVTFFLLCFLFYMGFQYIFPLLSAYRMRTGHLLKNAWLLSIAALPWTLCAMAVTAAAVFITFFMDPEALGSTLTIVVFAFFGVITYFKSLFFRQAFKRVQPI